MHRRQADHWMGLLDGGGGERSRRTTGGGAPIAAVPDPMHTHLTCGSGRASPRVAKYCASVLARALYYREPSSTDSVLGRKKLLRRRATEENERAEGGEKAREREEKEGEEKDNKRGQGREEHARGG